nr:thioredoxin family protein [candidate division Zixibacteria bacterium]
MAPVISRSAVEPGNTCDAALKVTVSPGWHINSDRPLQDYLIPANLEIDTLSELIPQDIQFPAASDIDLLGEKMAVFDGDVIIRFSVSTSPEATSGDYILPLRFTYQACNDRECRAPQTEAVDLMVTVGSGGRILSPDIFGQVENNITGGEEYLTANEVQKNPETESTLESLIRNFGFWGYFLALGLAYLTGVLLSFSPCTYPMIPITVSVFAGQNRSLGRGFILSLFYVGSMAIMYGLMGLIVSLVGGVFGAWLASPPVVIGIVAVFVIFALSMFGLFELQVPSSLRQRLGARQTGGGVGGSIVLGIIAALVVSPCVGPFVAGILLYIATYGSPVFGFLVLFIFAIGLGTLYLIIGTFSSAISALPGAGMWMESVKKFFGFVLLVMALYFLRTIISGEIYTILMGLLLIVYSVFGGGFDRLGSEDKFLPRLKKLLGLLAFIFGLYLLLGVMINHGFMSSKLSDRIPSSGIAHTNSEKSIDWRTDLESGLVRAREEGRPVLIDTWATWCANCRVLDKKTFAHPAVVTEMERFYPLRIQLETAGSDISREFMDRFGLKHYSLPTVLLLDSGGNIKRTLQGVVEPEDMVAEMRKIR